MPTTPEQFEAMRRQTEAGRGAIARRNGIVPLASSVAFAKEIGNERKLHEEIIAECKQRGWIYFHGSMAHKAMRTLGEPDFTILADRGRVFFVECKTVTGKLSPEQLALKVWAEKLHHTIHTVRSMEQFLEVVK